MKKLSSKSQSIGTKSARIRFHTNFTLVDVQDPCKENTFTRYCAGTYNILLMISRIILKRIIVIAIENPRYRVQCYLTGSCS